MQCTSDVCTPREIVIISTDDQSELLNTPQMFCCGETKHTHTHTLSVLHHRSIIKWTAHNSTSQRRVRPRHTQTQTHFSLIWCFNICTEIESGMKRQRQRGGTGKSKDKRKRCKLHNCLRLPSVIAHCLFFLS